MQKALPLLRLKLNQLNELNLLFLCKVQLVQLVQLFIVVLCIDEYDKMVSEKTAI